MKNTLVAFLVIFLVGLSVPARGTEDGPVRIAIRIFKIPAEQSIQGDRPDGRGGKISLQTSGNVISGFPDGTVFLPTELARNASESTVGRTIGERVAFGWGDLVAGKVQVRELKSLDFTLEKGQPSAEAEFEERLGEGRASNYEVRVELVSAARGEAVIRIRFDAGWSATGGSLGVGFSESVISAVAAHRCSSSADRRP
ncbi:MAG: hypothetical protein NT147_04055 [Candidatus Aminicenantes bacterium]|nr:hypothetical protein [Candidatus Aminicenantes bacterium]